MSDFYYDINNYPNFIGTSEIGKQKCMFADMAYKLAKNGFTKNKRIVLCSDQYLFYFREVPKQWTKNGFDKINQEPKCCIKFDQISKISKNLDGKILSFEFVFNKQSQVEFFKQNSDKIAKWKKEMEKKSLIKTKIKWIFQAVALRSSKTILEQIADYIEQTSLFQAKQASSRKVSFDPAFLTQGEKRSTKKLTELIKFDKSIDAENEDEQQESPAKQQKHDDSPTFTIEEEAYKPQLSIEVTQNTNSTKIEKSYTFSNEYEDQIVTSHEPIEKDSEFNYFKTRLSYNELEQPNFFPPFEKKSIVQEIKIEKPKIKELNTILHNFDVFDRKDEGIQKFCNNFDFLFNFIENLDKLKFAAKYIKYQPQLTQFTYADQVRLVKKNTTKFGILQVTENMILFYDYIPDNWVANSFHLLTKNPIYQIKLSNMLQYHHSKKGIEIKILKSSINLIQSNNQYFNAFQDAYSYHSIKYGTSLKPFEAKFSISHKNKQNVKKLIFLNKEYEISTQIFKLIDCFAQCQQLPKLYIFVQYLLTAQEVPRNKKEIINFMIKNFKRIKQKIKAFENLNQKGSQLIHSQIQNKIDKIESLKVQIEAMKKFYENQIK